MQVRRTHRPVITLNHRVGGSNPLQPTKVDKSDIHIQTLISERIFANSLKLIVKDQFP